MLVSQSEKTMCEYDKASTETSGDPDTEKTHPSKPLPCWGWS